MIESKGSYASVNGLKMHYEIHGEGKLLVLLHGALSTIEVDFGRLLPSFAEDRQIIAIEQQGHGHTAGIHRPLSTDQMVENTIALLRQLKIGKADFFGYSMGGGIALQLAVQHPDLVHKLVLASVAYNQDGLHPGHFARIGDLKVEYLAGSVFQEAYARTAPNPEDWHKLVDKISKVNREIRNWPPEAIQSIEAPTLVIMGDSDIFRPEHAVEMFRLLGGGVIGDIEGLPRSQLAILPGTTRLTLVERADWLYSMITEFLDSSMTTGRSSVAMTRPTYSA